MDHNSRIRAEFARQGESFAASPSVLGEEPIRRIIGAGGVRPDHVVLDACCGPGILSAALALEAARVVALDLTDHMLDLARRRCGDAQLSNVDFVGGHVEETPFPDDHFDASFCRLALHHVEDPQAVVAELGRVTRPGGTIVLADIITSEDAIEASMHNVLEMLRDPSHVRALSVSQLRDIARQLDLLVVLEKTWTVPRDFGDWIAITNSPERADLVLGVMEAYCQMGRTAGIDLHFAGRDSTFTHTWCLMALRA
jgi:2-polyprenyl-3-methyl-5-hydroxy-6-metoxy-1,4-benzoquinol methylase